MGGDEGSPLVDFLFGVFCTESFHLEIDPAGLNTEKISCPSRSQILDLVSPSPHVSKRFCPQTGQRRRAGSHLAGVLWTGLKGDGTRQVQRNLRRHGAGTLRIRTEEQNASTTTPPKSFCSAIQVLLFLDLGPGGTKDPDKLGCLVEPPPRAGYLERERVSVFSQLLHQAFLEPGQTLLRVWWRRKGLAVGHEQVFPEGQAENVQVFPTVTEGAGQGDKDCRQKRHQVGRTSCQRQRPAADQSGHRQWFCSGISPFLSFRYSGSIRTTPSETQRLIFSLDQ